MRVQVRVKVQVLLDCQVFVKPKSLRHIADTGLHGLRIGRDIDAQHVNGPRFRGEKTSCKADQGRLTRAVGTNQAGDSGTGNTDRHAVESFDLFIRTTHELLG